MSPDKGVVVTLRVPESLLERAEDLRELISEKREFTLKTKINRSDLLRYLLLKGIEEAEQEEDKVVDREANQAAREGRASE